MGQIDHDEARLAVARLPKTEEHKAKIAKGVTGPKNGMWRRKQSDKQKAAVSNAMSGVPKWYPVVTPKTALHGADNPRARAVIDDKGIEHPTVTEAARQIGVSRSSVQYRLRKKIYSYK